MFHVLTLSMLHPKSSHTRWGGGGANLQEKMQFHDCRPVGCLSPAALKRGMMG